MKSLIIVPIKYQNDSQANLFLYLQSEYTNSDILFIDRKYEDEKNILSDRGIKVLHMPLKSSYVSAVSAGLNFAGIHEYDIVIEFGYQQKYEEISLKDYISIVERKQADIILGKREFKIKKNSKFIYSLPEKKLADPHFRIKGYNRTVIDFFYNNQHLSPSADVILKLIKSKFTFREVEVNFKENIKVSFIDKVIYFFSIFTNFKNSIKKEAGNE